MNELHWVHQYWNCIRNVIAGTSEKDIRKKLVACRQRVIEYILGIVNYNAPIWGAHLSSIDWRSIAGYLPWSLVVARARLRYRGRPGSGQFLLPLEWGLLVHPVFLVPFFPGSAVKGLLRSVYMLLLGENSFDHDAAERCVEALLGSSEEPLSGVGAVVAFDAYPVGPGRGGVYVVGDVLTPHYGIGDGRGPVTELDAQPKPVQGVSVAEGTVFEFVVGVDEEYARRRLTGECLLGSPGAANLVARLLAVGLEYAGLGGKTTRGYGLFEIISAKLVKQTRTRHIKQ